MFEEPVYFLFVAILVHRFGNFWHKYWLSILSCGMCLNHITNDQIFVGLMYFNYALTCVFYHVQYKNAVNKVYVFLPLLLLLPAQSNQSFQSLNTP